MTAEIQRFASNCGISVDTDDLALIVQLVFGYLNKRQDGHRILFKLLKQAGFKTEQASYLKTYFKEGYLGMEEGKLSYNKLEKLSVWLFDNQKVIPEGMVEVTEQPDHTACDDCGILVPATYCSATVKEWNNGKERLVTLCNHCRSNKDDPKIRETGKRSTCEDCKLKGCTYWKDYHNLHAEDPFVNRARQLEHKPTTAQERYGVL